MSRLLAGAGAILAGIVVPAAAALALPRSAATAGITVPTVTVPTPTLPTVTVPTVSTPVVTVPARTVTVPTPTVPTPTVRTPTVPAPPVPPPTGGIPAAPTPGSPSSSASAPGATVGAPSQSFGPSGTVPFGAEPSRTGSGGTHRMDAQAARLQRPRVTRFRLPAGGVVRVAAWQLAPHCRFLGLYTVRARRGPNMLRVPRRVGRHRLRVGTYHFVGLSHGAKVLDVRFRLVRTKQRLRVRRHHLSDVCLAATPFAGSSFVGGGSSAASSGSPSPPPQASPAAGAHAVVKGNRPSFLPPVLHSLNPANASPFVRAIVFALLACAIALLTAASLPVRATAAVTRGVFVARHRAPITLGGFMLLVVAALLMLHL